MAEVQRNLVSQLEFVSVLTLPDALEGFFRFWKVVASMKSAAERHHKLTGEELQLAQEKAGPERWLPVFGWEAQYEVSSWGRVRSLVNNAQTLVEDPAKRRIRKTRLLEGGPDWSEMVMLERHVSEKHDKENWLVHRLVMLAFEPIDNADGMEVNHKDLNRRNNFLWNLEWLTKPDNMAHAAANNVMPYGEHHKESKLTSEQVRQIRLRRRAGESGYALGKEFGVSSTTIYHIEKMKSRCKDGLIEDGEV